MFLKVRVRKSALDHFRRRAREAYPLEIQAYLAGKVTSIDTIEITDFLYTKKYAEQTNATVCWYVDDLNKLKEKIESEGKIIIGEIHTHPEWDAVMSGTDYKSSITQQLSVCGIVSIHDNRTRVRFWTPLSALPCEIKYV